MLCFFTNTQISAGKITDSCDASVSGLRSPSSQDDNYERGPIPTQTHFFFN